MCIFSTPVDVSNTTIAVMPLGKDGIFRLIYCNKVAVENKTIMVLPVNSELKNIKLVELDKKYSDFSKNIQNDFDVWKNRGRTKSFTNSVAQDSAVPVIKYGPYDVSLTDSLGKVNWDAFGGITNKRQFFNLMNKIYTKHSFIIAKISNDSAPNDKRPICYDFKPINEVDLGLCNALIPTYHLHNGEIEEYPDWDHHVFVVNGDIDELHNSDIHYNILDSDIKDYFGSSIGKLYDDFNDMIPYRYMNVYRISNQDRFPNTDLYCKLNKKVTFNNIVTVKEFRENQYVAVPQQKEVSERKWKQQKVIVPVIILSVSVVYYYRNNIIKYFKESSRNITSSIITESISQ